MPTNYPDIAALILRVGIGGYMLCGHGYSKLLKLLEGGEIKFASVMGLSPTISLYLAVFAEFFACIFIIIGYKTKAFTVPCILTMIIAAFYIHGGDAWFMHGAKGGSKEPAMLYLIGFLAIYFNGSGKYSLDDQMYRLR